MSDIFRGLGIAIDIKTSDNFLKIVETLTRMGVGSKIKKKVWQSCHLLHKRDKQGKSHYRILHFKELYLLDGKESKIDEVDLERRNRITILLEEWNLINILDETLQVNEDIEVGFLVIPHKEKAEYELISKYQVGQRSK